MTNRWLKKYRLKEIGITWVSVLTTFWLLVEVASYFTSDKSDIIFKNGIFYIFFLLTSFFFALYWNRPRTSAKEKIDDRDAFLELKVGDAFKNKGALVVPFNNYLDVS